MSDPKSDEKPTDLQSMMTGDEANPFKTAMNGRKQPDPSLPAEQPRGMSHGSYHIDKAQPEMAPLDWRQYVSPRDPGKDYQLFDLEAGRMPEPSNTHIDQAQAGERQGDWFAYVGQSHAVDAKQRELAIDYRGFMEAQNSGDLQALGFVLPSVGWAGDIATLANQQVVAPGVKMESLFRSDGSLHTSAADESAIDQSAKSTAAHGPAKSAHDKSVGADHNLLAKYQSFDAASKRFLGDKQKVETARKELEVVELRHQVDEDRDALEKAKEHGEGVKSSLEFLAGGLVKYMVLEPHEFGDLIESVGVMASYAVGKVSGRSIDAAKEKLQQDVAQLHSAEAAAAQSRVKDAEADVLVSLTSLKAAREEVLVALQERQAAYEKAGNAAASASAGSSSSRNKIAGLMTAIPAAEYVYGLAASLADKAARAAHYSDAAAAGFHMAVYDQQVQARHFVSALDQIEYVRMHFTTIAGQWARRLGRLQQMQTRLGGVRPLALDPAMVSTESAASGEK